MPTDAYVGVGSNIDPERNIEAALDTLEERFGVIDCSGSYRSAPIGFDGDDFLNLVVRMKVTIGPAEIEKILSGLEDRSGRLRTGTGPGPRTLDLDLLLYGSSVDADLKLPHPDILNYGFVLRPLAELAPGLRHPITGEAVDQAWRDRAHMSPPLTRLE